MLDVDRHGGICISLELSDVVWKKLFKVCREVFELIELLPVALLKHIKIALVKTGAATERIMGQYSPSYEKNF